MLSLTFNTARNVCKLVCLFSVKTNLAPGKLYAIRKETIEMLNFITFP